MTPGSYISDFSHRLFSRGFPFGKKYMELWLKIGGAVLLATMFIVILPRAKHMLANSPKGSLQDWMGALFPILLVVLFVIFLISLV